MTNPKEIDQVLGKCLRLYRTLQGLTQSELGEKIGVSFQQIQKYENGATRISAAQLYNLSQALDVPVTDFYGQLAGVGEMMEVKSSVRSMEMLTHFQKLSPARQKMVIDLARTLGEGRREMG